MPITLEGSCRCGAVRFRLASHTPHPYQLCYCSICRKTAGGGGFAINIMGVAKTLSVTGRRALRVYRAVICDAAGQVLRDGINAEPNDADSNDAFRAAFPEYFAQPGASANLLHQRFRRAREDVKALLQAVVNRDELT